MSTMPASTGRTPQIMVIGSINMDLVTITPRVPEGGETIAATSFATHPGGKGANQAIACARASRNSPDPEEPLSVYGDDLAHVSMIGAVGQDAYADQLCNTLDKNGVIVAEITKVDDATGISTILVEEKTGQNRILFTAGANSSMKPNLVPDLSKESSRPDLIVMQLEIPVDTVLEVLRMAKKQGIDVLLNPAPASKLPDEALDGLAHLVLNETEAAIMCDLEAPKESENMSHFLDKAFKNLVARGVKCPIITLGGKGVAYLSPEKSEEPRWKIIDAHRVDKVVDTTAAGDTFVGYYAVGVVQGKRDEALTPGAGWDPSTAVGHANRAAALTVTKAGAMNSIPWMNELERVF